MNKKQRLDLLLAHIVANDNGEVLTTRELADEFNVSEITIRRDLQELAAAGVVQRQHGGVAAPRMPEHELKPIGVILVYNYGKFSNPFYNELLEGVDSRLEQLGYHAAFVKTFMELETDEQLYQMNRQYPTQGLLIIGGLPLERVDRLHQLQANLVVVLSHSNPRVDSILMDSFNGIRQMVGHLVGQGYERIGYIHGRGYSGTVDERLKGYLVGIEEHGLDDVSDLLIDIPHIGERQPTQMGQQGVETLMQLSNPPEAIMCSSDLIALGAMQWLHGHGYSIPEDVAVTGFDDIPDASLAYPPLTTVHVHKHLLGKLAVEQLHRRLNNPDDPPITTITPTYLVLRQSSMTVD